MKLVQDVNGNVLPDDKQREWRYADALGLRPSEVRFINDEPFAVFKDGTGIYGPCPKPPESFEKP